jgi:hypothetical protein
VQVFQVGSAFQKNKSVCVSNHDIYRTRGRRIKYYFDAKIKFSFFYSFSKEKACLYPLLDFYASKTYNNILWADLVLKK